MTVLTCIVGVHVTEQRTADTDCSEFRYFSCLLETGLENVLYSYESSYPLLLITGQWATVIQRCRYHCMNFFRAAYRGKYCNIVYENVYASQHSLVKSLFS